MTTLFNSIDKNIPAKLSSSRFSYPWVNRLIKRDIRQKQRLYNKVKKYGQSSHKFEFRKLRRSIDRKIRMSHNSYVRDIIGGSLKSDNTKPFWNLNLRGLMLVVSRRCRFKENSCPLPKIKPKP
ncbi:hypothetical protein HOLleu_27647 [Holothuria leucospilota]|uniref:Uncharacterized protein n=1 Tax=Holothuria leucospilota TaxID=206669 RepID=A0A9Q1BQQ0_HOLLE|nr:hypothetical protein HOLleu_27647 [Holothuria leucospilota]